MVVVCLDLNLKEKGGQIMADIEMPKSTPCQFNDKGWRPCKKPSNNGWCSEHEGLKCSSCGKQAVGNCDAGMGGLCCGALLCADCEHDHNSGKHVTKEVADAAREAKKKEEEARAASRTSPERRMNEELGVPKTLFELLKGDWQSENWELKKVYWLEIKHGLMGFFPAIFSADQDRIIITPDLDLLERVWQLLDPREVFLQEDVAYVNEEKGVAYYETDRPGERENSEPIQMLTVAEFERQVAEAGEEKPFGWAPGLIGGHRPSREQFVKSLTEQASKFDPSFLKTR